MSDLNNTFNIPAPGSPRFESDTIRALGKIRDSLGVGSDPSFGSIELPDATASRLVATDADKKLSSSDLFAWVAGTANRVTVADDADGTITLSGPQDIHVDATPEFAGLTIKHSDGTIIMQVDNTELYISSSIAAVPIDTGMPMGLLLSLTYNIP